jgi:hypothetical protein
MEANCRLDKSSSICVETIPTWLEAFAKFPHLLTCKNKIPIFLEAILETVL